MANHPYEAQPEKAFWKQTVSKKNFLAITDWYEKKWPIAEGRIATAGSCFAQHIGHQLKKNNFNFVDTEPPPNFLKKEKWQDFGYGMYSARYGNIYSARQLLQLIQRATGEFNPGESFWELEHGYVDPFRPTIQPDPFESVEELAQDRSAHLAAVASLFQKTDVFVFTLGLTEAWFSKSDGAVFPVCPGTKGGKFSPDKYGFANFSFHEVCEDMEEFIHRAREINSGMRFLLTVSPVALMATATDKQVVVATSYSKSVLRAAAGYLADKYDFVDYFPSYEIISSHVMRGAFYEPDMRSVVQHGVEHVMKQFFREHPCLNKDNPPKEAPADSEDDPMCDEALLQTFGEKHGQP